MCARVYVRLLRLCFCVCVYVVCVCCVSACVRACARVCTCMCVCVHVVLTFSHRAQDSMSSKASDLQPELDSLKKQLQEEKSRRQKHETEASDLQSDIDELKAKLAKTERAIGKTLRVLFECVCECDARLCDVTRVLHAHVSVVADGCMSLCACVCVCL